MVGNTYISMIFYYIVKKFLKQVISEIKIVLDHIDGVVSTLTKGFLKQTITYNLLQLLTQDSKWITCE